MSSFKFIAALLIKPFQKFRINLFVSYISVLHSIWVAYRKLFSYYLSNNQ